MRTFLVIPDAFDGGSKWEVVVIATDAQHACLLARTHLGATDITRFIRDTAGIPGEDAWTVREFPEKLPTLGAVPWERFKSSTWRATRDKNTVPPGQNNLHTAVTSEVTIQ